MPPPTLWARFRQTLGRALRETGQALDRVGIRGEVHAHTNRRLGDDPCKFMDHLSRHRNIMPLLRRGQPSIHDHVAYIAPCSTLIGSVVIGAESSVWYGAVLRADRCNNGMGHSQQHRHDAVPWMEQWKQMPKKDRNRVDLMSDDTCTGGGIFIGNKTNIQDGCVVSATEDHTVIGDYVAVGHLAQIHSATVEDYTLIGMGAVLCPGSKVERNAFVAAGAVVWRDVTVPSGELWVGNPARKLRELTQEEKEKLAFQAEEYVQVAKGQSQVMELGGNIPDTLIEHMLLGDGTEAAETSELAYAEVERNKILEERQTLTMAEEIKEVPKMSKEQWKKLERVEKEQEEDLTAEEEMEQLKVRSQ